MNTTSDISGFHVNPTNKPIVDAYQLFVSKQNAKYLVSHFAEKEHTGWELLPPNKHTLCSSDEWLYSAVNMDLGLAIEVCEGDALEQLPHANPHSPFKGEQPIVRIMTPNLIISGSSLEECLAALIDLQSDEDSKIVEFYRLISTAENTEV